MNSLLSPPPPVQKPRKIIVPLAIGLTWTADPEYIYQEKLDGRFSTLRIIVNHFPVALLAGELMPSGQFIAFDCLEYLGEDVREWPLGRRYIAFNSIMNHTHLPDHVRRVPESREPASFLQDLLTRGGEGIVRKHRDSLWGTPMEACKRLETFYCVITALNAGQSVQISLTGANGEHGATPAAQNSITSVTSGSQPVGNVALRGGKCDHIRIGSIIKVEGFGLTRAGQIREPRPCKDTPTSWLVKY